MKMFWISVALLLAALTGVTVNYIYINEVCDTLIEQIETLPDVNDDDCLASVKRIADYWNERVDYAGLSASYVITDRISEQSETLVACAECGDLYGFRTALALLRDAVGDLRRLESFSIGNIF